MSYCGKCGNVLEEEGHQCRIKDDPIPEPDDLKPPDSEYSAANPESILKTIIPKNPPHVMLVNQLNALFKQYEVRDYVFGFRIPLPGGVSGTLTHQNGDPCCNKGALGLLTKVNELKLEEVARKSVGMR